MSTMIISERTKANEEPNKKKDNFLTSKSFPNYLLLISLVVIVGLVISVIVVAVTKSKSSEKNETNNGINKETDNQKEDNEKEDNEKEDNKKEDNDDNLTPWQKYKKAEKYLYIWEYYTPDYILKLCQEHHFTRVYLSIGCIDTFWDNYYSKGNFPASGEIGSLDYETFIKQLNDINVEVELVTFLSGNPEDFTNVDRTIIVANMVKELSRKVKIKAFHFDQEPGDNNSYESLLKMYKNLNEIFPTSAILRPFWLRLKMSNLQSSFTDENFFNTFNDCETLVDAIMKVTTFTDLMAYNQNYEISTGYMEKLKEIANRHPENEAKNVIEISGEDGVPEDDTMHQRYLEDHDTFFNFIYDSSKKFGGITIHYYETWYKTLYCVWPSTKYEYEGGEPKNC